MLRNAIHDLRYALRQLRKSPGFTITAILTLALGIGALTTVATWTNAVLFSPYPHVVQPRQLRYIDATVLGGEGYSVHYDQFQFVREQGRSYQDAAAFALTSVNLTSAGTQPQSITAGVVSSNYFRLLGLTPQSGRFFVADANDKAFGANDEVVLSDRLWRERFNADPSLVGQSISINRHPFTVIGVAPAEFYGIFGGMAESAWLPVSGLRDLTADAPADPLLHYGLQAVVRLKPGVTHAAAAAELHTLARSFAQQKHDDSMNSWTLNLRDTAHFQRGLLGTVGEQLPILFGASLLLMILVCINIASLLGQHAARRRREVAIRTALGATPGRIASQVFAETALLACAGALAGWAASTVLARALYVLLPNFGIPIAFNLHTDVRILLFVAAVAATVALLCGLYPVRQSLRASQNEALHAGGAAIAGRAQNRLSSRILLGLQLGICFVVLVCSGLLTRTAMNIYNREPGFKRAGVMTAEFDLSRSGYNSDRARVFRTELLEGLRNAPGVAGATVTSHLPMGDEGSGNTQGLSVPGYVPAKGEEMDVVTDFDGPDFFSTMGIALDQGRDFAVTDNAKAPRVAIINEVMAHRYWPHENAIGHSVEVGHHLWQVVGIVHDFTYHNPQDTDPSPLLFLPMNQWDYPAYTVVAVRAAHSADAVTGQLRQAVRRLDPALPLENMRTLEEVSGQIYQMSRIPAELLGVYALASLVVAMMGLYAVMAYSVIERYREFALRMALGSTRAAVFRLILRGSLSVAAIGFVAGGVASIGAVRLLRSMLFGVAPFDPVSYGAAAAFLILTAVLSGLIPARRAAAIQPMQALRTE
jgi:predicted permease